MRWELRVWMGEGAFRDGCAFEVGVERDGKCNGFVVSAWSGAGVVMIGWCMPAQ